MFPSFTMEFLFSNSFYSKFQAPNAGELISTLEMDEGENVKYSWSDMCNVKTYRLSTEKYLPILKPSIELFARNAAIGELNYYMWDPWINFYSRNGFQELHDHSNHDIVCVFFLDTGTDFSEFYFYNRNHIQWSFNWRTLMELSDRFVPTIRKGDIMFFPGHMLHGVSPHRSDKVRRTLSFNLDITFPNA